MVKDGGNLVDCESYCGGTAESWYAVEGSKFLGRACGCMRVGHAWLFPHCLQLWDLGQRSQAVKGDAGQSVWGAQMIGVLGSTDCVVPWEVLVPSRQAGFLRWSRVV